MTDKIKVLVVEDEPFLLMLATDVVEDAGFDAITASNADEAMRILESRDDIRIIFTDVDMPGTMNGLKMAAIVRGRWPPMDFIVTSGHMHLQSNDMPERSRFFSKPYKSSEITAALQSMGA